MQGFPEGEGTMRLPNGQVVNGLWRNGEIYSVEGNSKVINNGSESRASYKDQTIVSNLSNRFN